MQVSKILPLAFLIPGAGFLVLALKKKASAQAAAAAEPATALPDQAPALPPDATAAQAAQTALDAQAQHDTAQDATQAAIARSEAATRQANESQAAADKARVQAELATLDFDKATNAGDKAAAKAAIDQAQAVHARETAAVQQATAEAATQQKVAAEAAKQALAAKQTKAKAVAHVHKVVAPAASTKNAQQALLLAATALRDFLVKFSSPEAFGMQGFPPSGPIQDFQRVATKYGHRLVVDGRMGPKTRSVGELVGIVFPPTPPRPAAHPLTTATHAATHPAVPVREPPPAPPGTPAPTGYNATQARALAAQVVANMRKLPAAKRYDYDRNLVAAFQRAAGLKADGIYGGGTRGALIFFGQANAPKPLFAPTSTTPYHAPAA